LWTHNILPHSGHAHLFFSFSTKRLIPKLLRALRFSIMLMPYLVLYRLSKCSSLAQGKLSQPKQYLILPLATISQFLIGHAIQDFDLWRSSPLQPRHALWSLPYARQRLQFIPQGAIRVAVMEFVFMDCFRVISRCRNGSHESLRLEAQRAHNRPGGLRSGSCFIRCERLNIPPICPSANPGPSYVCLGR